MRSKLIYLLMGVSILMPFFLADAQINSDADTLDVISMLAPLGDTVSIPINLVNSFYIGGFMFRITYDSLAFEACSVDTASRSSIFDYRMANLEEPGVVRYLATSFNPDRILEPGAGIIAYVNLYLRESAQGTVYTIAFENEDTITYDNQLSNATGDTLIIPVLMDGQVYVVQTGIDEDNVRLPANIVLLQNYPNPFNASTAISFAINEPGEAKLAIYDLLGREIFILADGYYEAGSHKFIYDAGELPSGVYFYNLKTGDISETRSMILLK